MASAAATRVKAGADLSFDISILPILVSEATLLRRNLAGPPRVVPTPLASSESKPTSAIHQIADRLSTKSAAVCARISLKLQDFSIAAAAAPTIVAHNFGTVGAAEGARVG
jgi:hypothetical protein